MKKVILATLIGTAMFSLTVNAHPQKGPMGGPQAEVIRLFKELDLTKAQRQDIRQALKEFRTDSEAMVAPEDVPDDSLRTILTTTPLDEAALKAAITEKVEAATPQRLRVAQLRNRIYNLLTDAQKTELASLQEAREAKREARAEKGPRPEREGRMPFDMLDLSDEQSQTIAQLRDAQKAQMEANRSTMEAFRSEEQALIQQSSLDETKWQALVAKYQGTMITAGVERAKTRAAIMAVLTDEQRETLDDMREDGRARKPPHPSFMRG